MYSVDVARALVRLMVGGLLALLVWHTGRVAAQTPQPLWQRGQWHQATSVSGCSLPRPATRGAERHGCFNKQIRVGSQPFLDICTGSTRTQSYAGNPTCNDFLRPEWDTVTVAGGIGMLGIYPAGCTAIRGEAEHPSPFQPPRRVTDAIVALRSDGESEARILGTGILIAADLVLTANHVVNPSDPAATEEIEYAVFGDRNRDLNPPMSHNDLKWVQIGRRADGSVNTIFGSPPEKLDYAVIRILKSSSVLNALPIPLAKRHQLENASWLDRPTVVGYTDNPFFPRGLVVSSGGVWAQTPQKAILEINNDLFYNVNTARGFSGGAVLNSQSQLVGIHLKAHSGDFGYRNMQGCFVDPVGADNKIRDFSRPNGGQSIHRIFEDIANSTSDKDLQHTFQDAEIVAAVVSYRTVHSLIWKPEPTVTRTLGLYAKKRIRFEVTEQAEAIVTPAAKPDCGQDSGSALDDGNCRAPFYENVAQAALPDEARRKRFAVGAIVGKTDEGKDLLLATGVMLSPEHVLTAGHAVPVPSEAANLRFVLDWTPDEPFTECKQVGKLVPEVLAGSARSRLDYALLKLHEPMKLVASDGACDWSLLRPVSRSASKLEVSGAIYALGHYLYNYPHPLSLFFGGFVSGLHRWPKDGGGSFNIDYTLRTTRGLSGGAVLDASFFWVALHQRSLNRARYDLLTDWHPYSHWYYERPSWHNFWRPLPVPCTEENQTTKNETRCFPGQGALVSDIVRDLSLQLGTTWMCANLPRVAEYLRDNSMNIQPCASKSANNTPRR